MMIASGNTQRPQDALLAPQQVARATERPGVPELEVATLPRTALIEVGDDRQFLNFDLLVTNHSQDNYRLAAIRLRVYDRAGKLEIERELNGNGKPAALDTVGALDLPPHSIIDIFQPFHDFDSNVDLSRLHVELFFMRAGHAAAPIPLTADRIVSADVLPAHYSPPKLCLPLHGRVLVHDGHDFYSHHRRFNLAGRYRASPATAVSPNLYAYDFVRIGPGGELFREDPTRKEDWLTYGVSIFSPREGMVQEAVTDVPENSFSATGAVQEPAQAAAVDPDGLGNHIKIVHADETVSWLLHMQPGSLMVKKGDRVHAGQLIGKVGFSGDSLFPHLHYTVTDGIPYPSQGVPSYFKNYVRILGSRRVRSSSGQIDTGDIIESDARSDVDE